MSRLTRSPLSHGRTRRPRRAPSQRHHDPLTPSELRPPPSFSLRTSQPQTSQALRSPLVSHPRVPPGPSTRPRDCRPFASLIYPSPTTRPSTTRNRLLTRPSPNKHRDWHRRPYNPFCLARQAFSLTASRPRPLNHRPRPHRH